MICFLSVDSAGSCSCIFPEGVSPFSIETVPTVTWKHNVQWIDESSGPWDP